MKKTHNLEIAMIISNSNSVVNNTNDDRISIYSHKKDEIIIHDDFDGEYYTINSSRSLELMDILKSHRKFNYDVLHYTMNGLYAEFNNISYNIKHMKMD